MSECSVTALPLQASRLETTSLTSKRRSPRDSTHPYLHAEKLEVSTSVQHYNIIENTRRTKTPQGVCRTEYVNRLGHIIFL